MVCYPDYIDHLFEHRELLLDDQSIVVFVDWNQDDVRTKVDIWLRELHTDVYVLQYVGVRTTFDASSWTASKSFGSGIGVMHLWRNHNNQTQPEMLYKQLFGTQQVVRRVVDRLYMQQLYNSRAHEPVRFSGIADFWTEVLLALKAAVRSLHILQIGMEMGEYPVLWSELFPTSWTVTIDW